MPPDHTSATFDAGILEYNRGLRCLPVGRVGAIVHEKLLYDVVSVRIMTNSVDNHSQ